MQLSNKKKQTSSESDAAIQRSVLEEVGIIEVGEELRDPATIELDDFHAAAAPFDADAFSACFISTGRFIVGEENFSIDKELRKNMILSKMNYLEGHALRRTINIIEVSSCSSSMASFVESWETIEGGTARGSGVMIAQAAASSGRLSEQQRWKLVHYDLVLPEAPANSKGGQQQASINADALKNSIKIDTMRNNSPSALRISSCPTKEEQQPYIYSATDSTLQQNITLGMKKLEMLSNHTDTLDIPLHTSPPELQRLRLQPGAVSIPGPNAVYTNEEEEDESVFDEMRSNDIGEEPPTTNNLRIDMEEENAPAVLLKATIVEDEHIIEATVVSELMMKRKRYCIIGSSIVAVIMIIGPVVGLILRGKGKFTTLSPSSSPSSSPSVAPTAYMPTLDRVKGAGVLRCATNSVGFAEDAFCHAVAAAVVGQSNKSYEIIYGSNKDAFTGLANESVDIITSVQYHTLEKNFFSQRTKQGFAFSSSIIFDATTVGGIPPYDKCAENLDTFGNCSDLKICVKDGSTNSHFFGERLPASAIVETSFNGRYFGLSKGTCNAIGGSKAAVAPPVVGAYGYTGPYATSKKIFSRNTFALTTRNDDPEWSDFVNAVVQALWAAEALNITQETGSSFMNTSVFGEEYETMFSNAIVAVGNIGEVYERTAEKFLPRETLNMVNTNESTGLIYSASFGDIQNTGPGPIQGGTLERIIERGTLRCGVRPNRKGFAEKIINTWNGFDIDYCRVLASSIFQSDRNAVEFLPYADSIGSLFQALANGTVDVAAGVGITLERDVREPTTGEGFSFSSPYFYTPAEGGSMHILANSTSEATLSLVTNQNDHQWSSYVYWIVQATFFAEQTGVTGATSFEMPRVNILGSPSEDGQDFRRMLRDAILVGNYGELYKRNVEAFIPRGGRNRLNVDPLGPGHYPFLVAAQQRKLAD